jgi:hypothetical protein
MPNLEQQWVAGWLTALRPDHADVEWPPAMRPIETQADVPQHLIALGTALDAAAAADLDALATSMRNASMRDGMRQIMAQLGAARLMRLLHWLTETDLPECHAVVAALLQDDDQTGRALRAAIAAVTRHAMLHRIFAPARIATLEMACNDAYQEAV